MTVTQDDACDCSVTESESRPGLKLERRCFVLHLYVSLCVSGKGNRVKSESGGEEDYLVKGGVHIFWEEGDILD